MTRRPLGLGQACVVLAAAVLLLFGIFGLWAFSRSGTVGLKAAGVAAVVCWQAATLALVITARLRYTEHAVSGVLIGTGVRLTVPLAAGLILDQHGGGLAEAGVFGWIVAFYLATLVIETWLCLSLKLTRGQESDKGNGTNG